MQIVSAHSSLQREWHCSSFVPLTVYKETREIQNLVDQAQIMNFPLQTYLQHLSVCCWNVEENQDVCLCTK
jgi:hypothetical protein